MAFIEVHKGFRTTSNLIKEEADLWISGVSIGVLLDHAAVYLAFFYLSVAELLDLHLEL